ncbi:MAG: hypothetical protein MJ078_07255, partial [Clostridia bacterium]|nr:hypothetical protein [Clostridia bacterium]
MTKKKKTVILTALISAVVLTAGLFWGLAPKGKAVFSAGNTVLREKPYTYLFACYKYEYLAKYKALQIPDNQGGWNRKDENGVPYGEVFKEEIDKTLRMKVAAADWFDRMGFSLSDGVFADISDALNRMETYSYGESPYELLKKRYGISLRELKETAVLEKKYEALYEALYGEGGKLAASVDPEGTEAFFQDRYKRYNLIFVENGNPTALQAIDSYLGSVSGAEASAAAFTELEALYSSYSVTKGEYPDGIYLCRGVDYSDVFSSELLAGFASLTADGEYTSFPSAEGDGVFYVMQYPLNPGAYKK